MTALLTTLQIPDAEVGLTLLLQGRGLRGPQDAAGMTALLTTLHIPDTEVGLTLLLQGRGLQGPKDAAGMTPLQATKSVFSKPNKRHRIRL